MVLSSALFGIFQSINKAHIPLYLMTGSVVLKLLLNPLLISIPQINISGATLSGTIGYIFITICGSVILNKYLPQKVNFFYAVKKPLIYGIICGFSAYIAYSLLNGKVSSTLNVLFSTFTGAIVYVILLILGGFFRTNGIIKRKNTKKIKKPLAKSRKIG